MESLKPFINGKGQSAPASSVLNKVLNTASNAAAVAQASATALSIPDDVVSSPTSWLGWLGHATLAIVRVIPGILIWIITFTTITLPTVLFALFSTSLTFTMNFTTLYANLVRLRGLADSI